MSLRVWTVAGGMMLMWNSLSYADGALSDSLEKNTTINFSVHVKEPICRMNVPAIVDFGEYDAHSIKNNVEKKFVVRLENCNQKVPSPKINFGGEYIDDSGYYIKNKTGWEYADGIGVFIMYKGERINLLGTIILDEVDKNTSKDFEFKALASVLDTVTPGLIDTNISINLTYY
ncbi:fimbrial protein [Escherichia coli]|uniref:fimbrial protein n=2 Tax=Escherichia coli TaxID=562 RepID=UPI0017A1E5BC|nr:type 1 fimbrial protein [Escherichia coli]HBA8071635.1 type 1 fimbrial protein [Escherichia coli]